MKQVKFFQISLVLLLLTLGNFLQANAQSPTIASTQGPDNEAYRAAAKIIVIPYNKQDQDIRSVLDDNPHLRTAVSRVKESFDQRGWSTVDFVANLNAAQANSAFTLDRQNNFKTDLLTSSGADFYVVVDVQIVPDNSENNTVINVTAFETHTGASFSNKTGTSKFATNDYDKLIFKAYEKIEEEFLNTLMVKTDEIREIGRATMMEFNIDENASLDFDTELDNGEYLNEAIEDFISANAYLGRANLSGILENKMVFDQVRIPLFDQVTNRPYNLNRFATEVIKMLRSKGIQATRNIHGQRMFITIKSQI